MKNYGSISSPTYIFTASGTLPQFSTVTAVDVLVVGGGGNVAPGCGILYMNYLLQPGTAFSITVGAAGQPSSIVAAVDSTMLFQAQSSQLPTQNIVNGARGQGAIITNTYAVIAGADNTAGVTNVYLASFGDVNVCKEFGSICDEEVPLMRAEAPYGIANTGSSSSSSGLVVIRQRKVYTGPSSSKAEFDRCFSTECFDPLELASLVGYEAENTFRLSRDLYVDVLMISAGDNPTALFARDAFFTGGVAYRVDTGNPNENTEAGRSSSIQDMFWVGDNGNFQVTYTSTRITKHDFVVFKVNQLQPGAVFMDMDGGSTSLCTYISQGPSCLLFNPRTVGRVYIKRAASMAHTCRSKCLAKNLVNLAPLSLCPAGKFQVSSSVGGCQPCANNTFRDLAHQLDQTCTKCLDGFITLASDANGREGSRLPSKCKNWCWFARQNATFSIASSTLGAGGNSSGIVYSMGDALYWYAFQSVQMVENQQFVMVLPRVTYADIFMIAGGGGGGKDFGGGGGAGAYLLSYSMSFLPGTYKIYIGPGGESQQSGKDTLIWHEDKLFLRVRGGAPGGSGSIAPPDGGCGGGAPSSIATRFSRAVNNGTNGTGFDGGRSIQSADASGAGGGGGIGGKGSDGYSMEELVYDNYVINWYAGKGGNAMQINFKGFAETFGGGGGGYGLQGTGGAAVTQVGGNGGNTRAVSPTQIVHDPGTDAVANTGSGGGGSGANGLPGGRGSAGLAIFR